MNLEELGIEVLFIPFPARLQPKPNREYWQNQRAEYVWCLMRDRYGPSFNLLPD
jgi:hypothetical protein